MDKNQKRGPHTFAVGDVVQLTGKFLRNTGQVAGGEGQKKWRVLKVDDALGMPTVVVDEPKADLGYWTEEELAADPMLRYRRIAACNLKRVNMPSSRDA